MIEKELISGAQTEEDEAQIKAFLEEVNDHRKVDLMVWPTRTQLIIDGIPALEIMPNPDGYKVKSVPDLLTFSEKVISKLHYASMEYDLSTHLSVSYIAPYETLGELLWDLREAVKKINLYGYSHYKTENTKQEA